MRTYDDTMFKDTFEHEFTWLNGVMRNVRRFSTRPAIIDPETNRHWDYQSLNKEANKLANALQKAGIKKDDVVMGTLRNSPEFVFAYVALRKLGAIFLCANYNLSSGEMKLLIEHNEPKAVIYTANSATNIKEAVEKSAFKTELVIIADNIENTKVPAGHISYEAFVQDSPDTEPQVTFRPHIYDEVLRLCTSGTTALPKCVPINDINEVLSAHDVIMHYPMNALDVTLNMTPWFHRGGCHSGGICPTLYAGASAVIMRQFRPHTALKWVNEYHITYMMGTPANLKMLVRAQEKEPQNLSAIKGIVTMGAPLSRTDCMEFIETLTPNIFNGYGTTETFWNSFLRPYNLPEGAGSVGGSCTDDEVRIVKIFDDKKAEPNDLIPQDSTAEGEVIIKSPAKTTYSYFKNEKATEEKFYKGWMYTGDVGTWDENCIVTIKGRKDDMIVVSGENIFPAQIEEILNDHEKVKDSIVTAVPDKVRGEAVAAYIVAKDSSLTIQELGEYCTSHSMLSKYKRPRYFAIVDELPFTTTGKKKHYEMKRRAVEDLKQGILKKA